MVNDTNQINLNILEKLVDESLSKETEESLNNFLNTFEMNTNTLKPFDLEAAKRGAKVVTRDGKPVRIICWDLTNSKYNYKLVALIKEDDGNEYILTFKENGMYEDGECESDLFMAPVKHEGWVNLYRDSSGSLFTSLVLDTKEKALSSIAVQSDCYVTTTRIEWVE